MPITHLAWRSAPLFQPLRKTHQLNFVLDAHISHRNLNDVEPLGDASYPLTPANCESLGNGFV